MVDIALDPNMYYCSMSTADTLRKAADLGFRYVELSPNEEFHFWHRYPKADDAFVTEMRKAVRETGVTIRTLNPCLTGRAPMRPSDATRCATGDVCWSWPTS